MLGNFTQLTLDKLAWHISSIMFLFCSSKSPAYDSEGAELDTFGTQERIEYNCFCDRILYPVCI